MKVTDERNEKTVPALSGGKAARLLVAAAGNRAVFGLLLVGTMLALQSCAYLATSKRWVPPPEAVLEKFSPAGVWLYEDKLVTGEANLDEHGNGKYPWKQGYFITETWAGGVWKGSWHQPGNDREGRFELQLSEDLTYAVGRWWYTRIGSNTSPDHPGGKFTMTRLSP